MNRDMTTTNAPFDSIHRGAVEHARSRRLKPGDIFDFRNVTFGVKWSEDGTKFVVECVPKDTTPDDLRGAPDFDTRVFESEDFDPTQCRGINPNGRLCQKDQLPEHSFCEHHQHIHEGAARWAAQQGIRLNTPFYYYYGDVNGPKVWFILLENGGLVYTRLGAKNRLQRQPELFQRPPGPNFAGRQR